MRVPDWMLSEPQFDQQCLVERELLRWIGWLSNTAEDRARAKALVLRLPAECFEYDGHRALYTAIREVLISGRWPSLIALLEHAGDEVSKLGGDAALSLLSQLPSGRMPTGECLWLVEEQVEWMLVRASRRRHVRELELALEAARKGQDGEALAHAREAFRGRPKKEAA